MVGRDGSQESPESLIRERLRLPNQESEADGSRTNPDAHDERSANDDARFG
jgi:hypothetical protein